LNAIGRSLIFHFSISDFKTKKPPIIEAGGLLRILSVHVLFWWVQKIKYADPYKEILKSY